MNKFIYIKAIITHMFFPSQSKLINCMNKKEEKFGFLDHE